MWWVFLHHIYLRCHIDNTFDIYIIQYISHKSNASRNYFFLPIFNHSAHMLIPSKCLMIHINNKPILLSFLVAFCNEKFLVSEASISFERSEKEMKFWNIFSSCMMRRIKKCHRGGFSEKTANQVFLSAAKTALTIFLKFCISPYFDLIFLMKKIFDPPKQIMTSF